MPFLPKKQFLFLKKNKLFISLAIIGISFILFHYNIFRENLESNTPVAATPPSAPYIGVTIKDNTIGTPNIKPNGNYSLSLNHGYSKKNDTKPFVLGQSDPTYLSYGTPDPNPTSDSLTFSVTPSVTPGITDKHLGDIFPNQFQIDITFDSTYGPTWAVISASDTNIYIDGKTLNINQLGIIVDSNKNTLGYVKNDTFNQNHWMIIINKPCDISSIIFNWKAPRNNPNTYPSA
jgi:hypothetical protein